MHEAKHLHAVARAISGGPVYVSDKLKKHDFNLIKQLVLRNGQILRARKAGRPTRDCMFKDVSRDGKSLLKVTRTCIIKIIDYPCLLFFFKIKICSLYNTV